MTDDTLPVPVTLDRMTFEELDGLMCDLAAMLDAGRSLADAGYAPLFSLTPGRRITLSISERMPRSVRIDRGIQLGEDPREAARRFAAGFAAADRAYWRARYDAEAAAEMPEPLAAGVEHEGIATADPDNAAVAPTEPEPAPAPVTSASARPAAWTAEEDQRLIEGVAALMLRGMSMASAGRKLAAELGRPEEGTLFRLKTKLRGAVDDRLADLRQQLLRPAVPAQTDLPEPEPEPAPVAPSLPPAGEAAGAPFLPAPAADLPDAAVALSAVEAHVFALPRRAGWTMDDDLRLLELAEAGWQPGEIAAELGTDTKAIGARWDQLSGYDRDTKTRRWTRAELIEALKGWAKAAA